MRTLASILLATFLCGCSAKAEEPKYVFHIRWEQQPGVMSFTVEDNNKLVVTDLATHMCSQRGCFAAVQLYTEGTHAISVRAENPAGVSLPTLIWVTLSKVGTSYVIQEYTPTFPRMGDVRSVPDEAEKDDDVYTPQSHDR